MTKAEQKAREIFDDCAEFFDDCTPINLSEEDIIKKITAALVEAGKVNFPSKDEYAVWVGSRVLQNNAPSAEDTYDWLREQLTKERG